MHEAYPKPGAYGGRLIRQVIAHLRAHDVSMPLVSPGSSASHILCALSGGADSTALACLLARYGRRLLPHSQLTLLHINHGWRAGASDQDECFVSRLAKKLGLPLVIERLPGAQHIPKGQSWEENARLERQAIFKRQKGLVLTAHHADDLAETALWRLLTGADQTHRGGILVKTGTELRPFLGVRKAELLGFLKEEGQRYRKDSTNLEERFLRARMRAKLMPEMERLFPRGVQHLVTRALAAQIVGGADSKNRVEIGPIQALLDAAGIRPRRAHFQSLTRDQRAELHLPGGWRLKGTGKDQWTLEKIL